MAGRERAKSRIDVVVRRFMVDAHDAHRGLMRAFHLDHAQAHQFLDALPCVAKHGADRTTADRYVAALRSIGAEVELVDSVSGAPIHSDGDSLPTPSSSLAPAFTESMRVERAADDAIARFKQEEALASVRPWGADHDPTIPRAPRVPHDLGRMPNARVDFSEPPDAWDDLPNSDAPGLRAAPPPARTSFDSGARTSHSPGVATGVATSTRPERVGAAPPLVLSLPPEPRRRSPWPLLVIALVASTLFALQQLGAFTTKADEERAAWEREGIVSGEHALLPGWLDRPERTVAGIETQPLLKLIGGLERAGAEHIWAIRIAAGEDATAEALLVELPRRPEARRTVLWLLGRSPGHDSSTFKDRGQRFQEVTFESGPVP